MELALTRIPPDSETFADLQDRQYNETPMTYPNSFKSDQNKSAKDRSHRVIMKRNHLFEPEESFPYTI
jgi:hypothetical protein